MSRTKSSSIAKIKELATSLIEVIDSLQAEMDNLTFNSDRLKEIEPALAKLQAALKPATFETVAGEPVTSEPVTSEPVKRARRIKKKLSNPDNIPPAEET